MRNCFVVLLVTMFLVCGLGSIAKAEEGTGLDLTGKQWLESTRNEKLAFLYGASSIVAIEHVLSEKTGEKPSVFVHTWMQALKDTHWSTLQEKLDAWYAAHPNNTNRQVFDVLWHEIMIPAVKQ